MGEKEGLESRADALTKELETVKAANALLESQYKNAQEDVNFAQMCVKNLQATLAVCKKEEKAEEAVVEVKEEEAVKEEEVKACEACAKKEEKIEAQQARLCVMDAELVKTRRMAREKVGMAR